VYKTQVPGGSGVLQFAGGTGYVPVLITGLLAWQWQLEGQRLKGILPMHLVLGCASLLIWIVCAVHVRAQRKLGGALLGYRLPIEAAGVVLVTLTGHLGGFSQRRESPQLRSTEQPQVCAQSDAKSGGASRVQK
jgi:hypothetical protein